MTTHGYTVVQHSGYGFNEDPQFRQGLESAHLDTAEQAQKVRDIGGMVFTTYSQAEDYAMKEQYPGEGFYLTPRAPGHFASMEVGGLRVYLPATS
jgi:hypothetical protein